MRLSALAGREVEGGRGGRKGLTLVPLSAHFVNFWRGSGRCGERVGLASRSGDRAQQCMGTCLHRSASGAAQAAISIDEGRRVACA